MFIDLADIRQYVLWQYHPIPDRAIQDHMLYHQLADELGKLRRVIQRYAGHELGLTV